MIENKEQFMLIYGIKGERLEKFTQMANQYKYGIIEAKDNQLESKVGALIGEKGYEIVESKNEPYDIEFILFVNIKNDDLYNFIQDLKDVGLYFPNKALLTKNNMNWTLKYLFGENKLEHEVMSLYTQLRKASAVAEELIKAGQGNEKLEKALEMAEDYMHPQEFNFEELKNIYNNLAIEVNKAILKD